MAGFWRHFGLGITLILVASAILLMSDPRRQRAAAGSDVPLKVAIVNYTSVPVLEAGEAGVIEGLAEAGFIDGRNIEITRYNAEGDRPTAILIAKEVVGRDFDLIITVSTPTLQAVANANRETQRKHVFTLSTDPWGAGVGLHRDDPSKDPPYMTGQGSLQPVASLFKLARDANPKLKKVGVAWNPAESNSEASTVMARAVCKELDIELIEVTVDSPSAVVDAARALVNRGVEAIWAGGDTTVSAATDTLVATAKGAGIPVFTNMPSDVKQGVLFSLGADYFEVGRSSGELAARILRGTPPSEIPAENYVPEQLAINLSAREGLAGNWTIDPKWRTRARIVVDESGVHEQQRQSRRQPQPGRTYRVGIAYFAPDSVTDVTIDGLKRRLAERGFIEGKNLVYQLDHAQGDIAIIPAIMQKLDQSDADLIVALTTPCLTAACTAVKNKPVVFTEVYDPIAAGAGTAADDHLPHVTGVGSFPPLERMTEVLRQVVPGLKSVGVVYNDSEANSRKVVGVAREMLRMQGLKLEEVTVTNSSEVLQAARVLTQRGAEVLWEIGDNTVFQGMEGLIKAGLEAGVPVANNDADSVGRGALVGVGISFHESGLAAGDVAARVLLGESPAHIPFEEVAVVRSGVNFETAHKLGRTLPFEFLRTCDVFHGIAARHGRPARMAFVTLSDGPALEAAEAGVFDGLREAGIAVGTDLEIQRFNAQGDMAQLPQIFQTIEANAVDLIVTSTTPAMIAAARATSTTPIVFTVASDPPAVGVFPEGERMPNLVGVYDDPPINDLLDLAERREGTLSVVGTVWNPAEPNSEISVKRLRAACRQRGLKLEERHASAVSELRDVTSAICLAGIDILIISADNVTSSGFPAIVSVTGPQRIPVYCTEPDLVQKGAAGAVGVNFHDWGRQSARLAAQVLAGIKPNAIEFEKVQSIRTVTQDADTLNATGR